MPSGLPAAKVKAVAVVVRFGDNNGKARGDCKHIEMTDNLVPCGKVTVCMYDKGMYDVDLGLTHLSVSLETKDSVLENIVSLRNYIYLMGHL